MLLISRKTGESFLIGDEVEVTVLKIEKGQVRLGVTAPRRIPVYRREIYDAIQEQNRLSVQSQPGDLDKAFPPPVK